jgi:hypothetical protein
MKVRDAIKLVEADGWRIVRIWYTAATLKQAGLKK